jgi:L-asparaginase II
MSDPPALVRVVRGGLVESEHEVHVAVADADGTAAVALLLRGDREHVRIRTVVNSLDLLRRRLTGLPARSGEHSGSLG